MEAGYKVEMRMTQILTLLQQGKLDCSLQLCCYWYNTKTAINWQSHSKITNTLVYILLFVGILNVPNLTNFNSFDELYIVCNKKKDTKTIKCVPCCVFCSCSKAFGSHVSSSGDVKVSFTTSAMFPGDPVTPTISHGYLNSPSHHSRDPESSLFPESSGPVNSNMLLSNRVPQKFLYRQNWQTPRFNILGQNKPCYKFKSLRNSEFGLLQTSLYIFNKWS